jgi:hypothetical protein
VYVAHYARAVLVVLGVMPAERAWAQAVDSAGAPVPVTAAEVELPGFEFYPDSAEVRRRYGTPWRRDIWFRQAGDSAERWRYRSRAVYLDTGGSAIAVEYTRPGPRTKRGLQVGDSAARVLALYGRPRYMNFDEPTPAVPGGGLWRYPGQSGVLTITVAHARVVSILLGSDLTNE